MKEKQLQYLWMGSLFLLNRRKAILLMPLFVLSVNAQHVLTKEYHAPRAGDRLIKQQMEYTSSGVEGENLCWDFSRVTIQNQRFETLWIGGQDTIAQVLPHAINLVQLRQDSLFIVRAQDDLYDVSFSSPLLLTYFPTAYRDSYRSSYHGRGCYCGTNATKCAGEVIVCADAHGRIILSENDTIDNVLRLYTLRTSSVCMSVDTCITEDIVGKQLIEEIYQWYARGYRYPLYETISQSYYDSLTPISCIQTAYRYLPEEQEFITDSLNATILTEDSLRNSTQAPDNIISYKIHTGNGNVTIDYSLTAKGNVRALLTDAYGIVYKYGSQTHESGSGYSISFSTAGLRRGNYVIYINVNGRIYNEKFRKE